MKPIFFQTFLHWEPKIDDGEGGEEIARQCREKLRFIGLEEGNYKLSSVKNTQLPITLDTLSFGNINQQDIYHYLLRCHCQGAQF